MIGRRRDAGAPSAPEPGPKTDVVGMADPLAGLMGIASGGSSSDDDSADEADQHSAKRARADSDEDDDDDERTGSSDEDEEAAAARRKRKRLAAARKPAKSAVVSGAAASVGFGSVDELFAATDSSFLPSEAIVEVQTVDREQEQAQAQAAAKVCSPPLLVGRLVRLLACSVGRSITR